MLAWLRQHRLIAKLFMLMALTDLYGCASMSPEQCVRADWRQIGYADGVKGLSGARIDDHAKACAKVGVRPDLDEYLQGRAQGLLSYCQPENGFALGRGGHRENAADCPAHLKPAFLVQYDRGSQIHAIESELASRHARFDGNHRHLRHVDERIMDIRNELAKRDLSADHRNVLLNELNRLIDKKEALIQENLFLQNDINQLQAQLQYKLMEFGYQPN